MMAPTCCAHNESSRILTCLGVFSFVVIQIITDAACILFLQPVALPFVLVEPPPPVGILITCWTSFNLLMDILALSALINRNPIKCLLYSIFVLLRHVIRILSQSFALLFIDLDNKDAVLDLLGCIGFAFIQHPLLYCIAEYCREVLLLSDISSPDKEMELTAYQKPILQIGAKVFSINLWHDNDKIEQSEPCDKCLHQRSTELNNC